MYNFLDKIKDSPTFYRQFSVDEELITQYDCPIEENRVEIWSHQSYFVYVIEGKKIWHIPGKSFELTQGKCIFVKKGAHIVEQFFDSRFCVVIFFVSDRFIAETIRQHLLSEQRPTRPADDGLAIYEVDADDALHGFFNSIAPYFLKGQEVNKGLLRLKFNELILSVAGNVNNHKLRDYFCSLLSESSYESLRMIMEENFSHNLSLKEYARLCGRSLSALKRDFEIYFNTTPGRWLLDRRLQQAQLLLSNSNTSVSEIAYACGFENVSHFSRVFKAAQGVSPTQYRQIPEL